MKYNNFKGKGFGVIIGTLWKSIYGEKYVKLVQFLNNNLTKLTIIKIFRGSPHTNKYTV